MDCSGEITGSQASSPPLFRSYSSSDDSVSNGRIPNLYSDIPPILMLSLPDTPTPPVKPATAAAPASGDLDLGLQTVAEELVADKLPLISVADQYPVPSLSSPAISDVGDPQGGRKAGRPSDSQKKQARAVRKRSKGARISSSASSPSGIATGEKTVDSAQSSPTSDLGNQSIAASNAVSGQRRLPDSVHGSAAEENKATGGIACDEGKWPKAWTGLNQLLPKNLRDAINMTAGKPNRRFENVDILDILKMKGMELPNPRWWRPGGYGPESIHDAEESRATE